MAIDPRIPMMGITPDIAGAMSQGILSGERMAQAPIRNQMLQQQVDMQSQQMQLAPLQLEAARQTIDLNKGTLGDAVNARKQEAGAFVYNSALALRDLPEGDPRRAAAFAGFNQNMKNMGYSEALGLGELGDDLSDASLDSIVAAYKPYSQMGVEGLTAGQREFQSMTKGLTPEQANLARRIKLGLDPRAVTRADTIVSIGEVPYIFDEQTNSMIPVRVDGQNVDADTVAASTRTVAEGQSSGSSIGKSKEERRGERIIFGQDAAKGLPTIRRALLLLDKVETGGVNAVSLAVRSSLGLESADEGELSNKLGKAVLSQLKATFGAAFSEKEGSRLARIEAGFGKNTATNQRLLNELLQTGNKYANQAIKDSLEIEDYATAASIKENMDFEFDEDANFLGASSGPKEGDIVINEAGESLMLINNQWVKQ